MASTIDPVLFVVKGAPQVVKKHFDSWDECYTGSFGNQAQICIRCWTNSLDMHHSGAC